MDPLDKNSIHPGIIIAAIGVMIWFILAIAHFSGGKISPEITFAVVMFGILVFVFGLALAYFFKKK